MELPHYPLDSKNDVEQSGDEKKKKVTFDSVPVIFYVEANDNSNFEQLDRVRKLMHALSLRKKNKK